MTSTMPRFRPRISLLSALLLMTIAGMAIVIVQLWQEVGPLREEVIQRRAEMGQLYVTDTSKAHAIGVDWDADGVWRWRIFLPERPNRGNNWIIRTYIGKHRAFAGDELEKWLAGPRTDEGIESGSGGGIRDGESTLEIKLAKDRDGWYLQQGKENKDRIPAEYNVWLDDPNLRFPMSKVLSSEQTIYDSGDPIVLLCIQQANDSRTNGVDGDTILVWIEEDR